MSSKPLRIAVMLDIGTAYLRHTSRFAGAYKYAMEQDWDVIIDEYADDLLPTRRSKKPLPYDGVIARATRKLAERASRLKLPIVNVWLNSPVYDSVPSVFPDSTAIGKLRAEHLLVRGFRNFAALTPTTRAHKLETASFCETVRAEGFDCSTAHVSLSPSASLSIWRSTGQTIDSLMDTWDLPIGVYVGEEYFARMLVQRCRSRGWRVPEDVAIIAGWNEESLCERPRPTLTSVDAGGERIGYEAAAMLHRLLEGHPPPTRPLLLPPVGVVVRESTDFLAVEDELVAAALSFIAGNSHRRIGPNEVAHAIGAHPRTLQLRFQKYLNRPIATEIRRVRIERAKRELTQSDRPLSEIARDVGFGVSMRMYEVFRRELGVTPSDYRKQHSLKP